MMKVLITGATGFVGRRLVENLLSHGHAVRALSRDAKRAARVLPVRCHCDEWDPQDGVDRTALKDSDAIIHLAGEGIADQRWTSERKIVIRQSRIGTTQTLVRAIERLPDHERPEVFICASAIGYYGDRGDAKLDEDSPAGEGFLADICRAWEDEAFRCQALGLRTATIRIGIVLGRQGGALRQLLPVFRLGLGGRVGSGGQWMSWIHIDDLCEMFRFVLENDNATGSINGVAPVPVINARFTSTLGRVLRRPTVLPVPAVVLRVVLGEMATVLLASQRVRAETATALGFRFTFPTLAAALTDLCQDFSEEFDCEQWISRPPTEAFRFFSDAYNLEKITPDFLRFRVTGMSTPEIRKGTRINYRLRIRRLPVRWQSLIESWQPPVRFVDRQTVGPYRLWHHTHEFEPYRNGTIVKDRVRYELPTGVLGQLVAGRLVARDIREIFSFRRKMTETLLSPEQNPESSLK